MVIYREEGSDRRFFAHYDLLSNCSKLIAKALEVPASESEILVLGTDCDEWLTELFQHWLYFRTWKWPCHDMREDFKSFCDHDDDCGGPAPTQQEIVQVICFANKYEILELLAAAEAKLCEVLNQGLGVDVCAIYCAQRNLCRYHPVLQVIAKAYAACGNSDSFNGSFFDEMKPSFMSDVLLEIAILRMDSALQGKDHYDFQVEHFRPMHDDHDTEMLYDTDSVTVAEGTKINKEAV